MANPVHEVNRYCMQCLHSLQGISSSQCPECGHPFDLRDPSTYSRSPKRLSRRARRWFMMVALSPLSILVTLHSTYLLAAVSLGRWPRVYQDDPKYINQFVGLFHAITGINFLLLPILTLVSIGMFWYGIFKYLDRHPAFSWLYFISMVGVGLCSWAAIVIVLKIDPFRVSLWFFD